MKLQSEETVLSGAWILENDKMIADAASERIEGLIADHLLKVAESPESGAWETLYKDPDDGRYWACTYPQSNLHGGGPPRLTCLTADQAKEKFGI